MEEEILFTVDEANELLPELEDLLMVIRRERRLLVRVDPEVKKAMSQAAHDGGTPQGPRYLHAIETIVDSIQKIHDLGVVVKDLDRGLCDFPCRVDGRTVYLCWKPGEPEIAWWHELNSDFTGRQPLGLT